MVQQSVRPAASSSFRHFVALALHTSDTDDACLLNAVRVDEGKPAEAISTSDVTVIEGQLAAWVANRPVVIHGLGQLTESRLGEVLSATVLSTVDPSFIDAQQLARIVLPRLRDHGLETLASCFGIEVGGDDPVEQGAACLAEVFLYLLDVLFTLELDAVRHLTRLSQGTESSLLDLFVETEAYVIKNAFNREKRPQFQADQLIPSYNVAGSGAIGSDEWLEDLDIDEEETFQVLNTDDIAAMFEDGGVIEQAMERYERRPQQVSMVRAVANTFNDGEFLIVEAGTGTGKSLSYLVPAIYWALRNDQRIIISTNTKNLQEQLFFKDVPFLMKTLQADFRVSLLKGRSNYICPDRWQQALEQPDDHLSLREREEALPLVVWARETSTGDISENIGFHIQTNRNLWHKVNGEGGACPKCIFNDHCFVNRARSSAALSHLVIINHALLFSDLAADNAVLSDYSHLIIDEAHNLEKVAVQHMTIEVSVWRIRNLLRKLYVREGIETGMLATLQWRSERSPMKQVWKDQLAGATRLGIDAVNELDRAADAFYEALNTEAFRIAPKNAGMYTTKFRYQADSDFARFLNDRAPEVMQPFVHLRDTLGRLGEVLNEIPESWLADREEFLNTVVSSLETCRGIEEDLAALFKADEGNTVYWVEASTRSETSCVLIAAPLNVAERLYEDLFNNMRTVILTSATLTIGTKFGYVAGRLGLDKIGAPRLKTFRIGSPFDYQDQTLVCVPSTFPSPKASAFQDAVSELIQGLVLATRRGTLVLFTSYGMLNRTYEDLELPLGRLGIPVLAQGISGPRTMILDRFRNISGSVLLGTDSFWEGIDVPGEALEMVVLVKLPFAVPSEPIVEAQIEKLDQAGRNSFLEYLVPEAVIKFRQGFGRLIRSTEDRGVVVVLDQRVISTRYGQLFLDSLPTGHRAFRTADALIEGVTRWFEKSARMKAEG